MMQITIENESLITNPNLTIVCLSTLIETMMKTGLVKAESHLYSYSVIKLYGLTERKIISKVDIMAKILIMIQAKVADLPISRY